MPPSSSSTPHSNPLTGSPSSVKLGNGLIEIAALTTVIGSTTAESLMLGNRGAVGLLWGTMSMFGALSVIKAGVAAATPAWLREAFGIRSKETDAALGVALTLKNKESRSRNNRFSGVCGVGCRIAVRGKEKDAAQSETVETSCEDIYAFDQSTLGILEMVPEYEANGSLHVSLLARDVYQQERSSQNFWKDWIGIFVSNLKLVEVTILWRFQALELCLISGCCWVFYLCASVILQVTGLSREYSETVKERQIDLVAGQLPTPVKAGGQRKILLGAPQNVRNSKIWHTIWALGTVVSTASVIGAYMTLGLQEPHVFAAWTAFQFLWLALRSVFYHFAESSDRVFNPTILNKGWKELNPYLRMRVRRLVQALSLYQIHMHPRRLYCYDEDERAIRDIYNTHLVFPLPILQGKEGIKGSISVVISAIIGDTLLSSASFAIGRKYAPMDLYDACVVILKVDGVDISIPAARVMSGKPPPRYLNDSEAGTELPLVPKGGSNTGKPNISWWYWIPCSKDLWLELHTTDMQILGERHAKILSGEQVTKHLCSGEFYVSISEVGQVWETVTHSRLAFEALQTLLP